MTTVKTTINIDEETWNRFKSAVSSRQGSARNLNGAVEEAIRSFDTEGLLSAFMEAMGIEAGGHPSLREVERSRPRLETSAGETVRRMRGAKGDLYIWKKAASYRLSGKRAFKPSTSRRSEIKPSTLYQRQYDHTHPRAPPRQEQVQK